MRNLYIILSLFLFLTSKTYANKNSTIEIRINPNIINGGKVVLLVHDNYLEPFDVFFTRQFDEQVYRDSVFVFNINHEDDYFFMNLYYKDEQNNIHRSWNGMDAIIIQSGSKVIINLGKDYNIENSLDSSPLLLYQYKLKQIKSSVSKTYSKNIRERSWNAFKSTVTYFENLDNVSIPNDNLIEKGIFDGIRRNLKYKYLKGKLQLARLQGGLTKNNLIGDIVAYEALIRFQSLAYNLLNEGKHDYFVPYYASLLYQLELLNFRLINSGKKDVDFFYELSEYLTLNFKDLLRDELLSFHYLNSIAFEIDPTFDNFHKIKPLLKNEKYLNYFTALSNSLQNESIPYHFSLYDISGKEYNLNSFQGKVLILEFWFNGCTPCKALSKSLNDFLDNYENNDKIQLVTINVDLKKENWLEGLKSGLYTSNRSIDLHIGNLGHFDPMLNHYAFNGFPQLILIDQNTKLVTARAPKPLSKSSKENLEKVLNQLFK